MAHRRKHREFSSQTKRNLGERVAYICSNPNCRILTIKRKIDSERATKDGKASHINAASDEGPRFDENLTDKEISDFKNGIWLCSKCSGEVDDNKSKYLKEELIRWKETTEAYVETLMTQETRLRHLRILMNDAITRMRILNGVPGPTNHFDQTFKDAGHIPFTRILIELEQQLFENTFTSEADALNILMMDLDTIVFRQIEQVKEGEYIDISPWKNRAVQLMTNIMQYSNQSFERYLLRETEMVERKLNGLKGSVVRHLDLSESKIT